MFFFNRNPTLYREYSKKESKIRLIHYLYNDAEQFIKDVLIRAKKVLEVTCTDSFNGKFTQQFYYYKDDHEHHIIILRNNKILHGEVIIRDDINIEEAIKAFEYFNQMISRSHPTDIKNIILAMLNISELETIATNLIISGI